MTIFYRGAGRGTHWHDNDAQTSGFLPKARAVEPSLDRLIHHIARANVASPYVSLTYSFGVAHEYAIFGRATALIDDPGYVYEIELTSPLPNGLQLVDPIREIVLAAPTLPSQTPYWHDGDQDFLLGVVSAEMNEYLSRPIIQPYPSGGAQRSANLSLELETLARALRDAEILAIGDIPAACIRYRHEVWGESDGS